MGKMKAKKKSWFAKSNASKDPPRPVVPTLGPLVQARLSQVGPFAGWPGLEALYELGQAELAVRDRLVVVRRIASGRAVTAERAHRCIESEQQLLGPGGDLSGCLRLWPAHVDYFSKRQPLLLDALIRLEGQCKEVEEDTAQIAQLEVRWRNEWGGSVAQVSPEQRDLIMRSILGYDSRESFFASLQSRAALRSSVERFESTLRALRAIGETARHAAEVLGADDGEGAEPTPAAAFLRPLAEWRADSFGRERKRVTASGLVISSATRTQLTSLEVETTAARAALSRTYFRTLVKEPIRTWLKLITAKVK